MKMKRGPAPGNGATALSAGSVLRGTGRAAPGGTSRTANRSHRWSGEICVEKAVHKAIVSIPRDPQNGYLHVEPEIAHHPPVWKLIPPSN